MSINFINNAHHEKMLVKVRNKETGQTRFVTRRAYELAKRNYDFLGNEPNDKADVFDPKGSESTSQTISTAQTVTLPKADTQTGSQHIQDGASAITRTEPQTEDSPNPQPTAEKEKVAEAVAENNGQPKKRGRPAKTQNQISSPAAISEV